MQTRDLSDRLVKKAQLKTLTKFVKAVRTMESNDPRVSRLNSMRAELAQIVSIRGTNSIAYDNYLQSIRAFLGR